MRTIIARKDQTVFDIALQEYGSIEAAFDILAANAYLRPDMAIAQGQVVFIPSVAIKPAVVDYYSRNGIFPATGNGENIELTSQDMVNISQKLNYDLANGPTQFFGVRIPNLKGNLTVQIDYTGIPDLATKIHLEQSLDGVDYSLIPGSYFHLDPSQQSHSYNIIGLLTNYVRVVIDECTEGTIKETIFRV